MKDTSVQFLWKSIKRSLSKRKKTYLIILFNFVIIGIIASYTTNDEFQAEVLVLPELGGSSSAIFSGLGELQGLLGVATSKGGVSGGFGPDMYQEIIESQPFLSELVATKFANSKANKDSITLNDYFKGGEKRNLISRTSTFIKDIPTIIEGLFTRTKNNTIEEDPDFIKKEITPALLRANEVPPIVQIDGAKNQVMNIVKNRIKIDAKGREIKITVKMPEPVLSAQVCKLVLEKLIEYVSTYKTAKQRDNLRFLEQRKEEAESKYKQVQMNVAGFKDNSLGLIFQSVQTKETVLQNDLNLAFTIYNQLAGQLEQAKIDLKKESPIFSSLNPIEIPNTRAEPITWKILFKYLSIGIVVCLIVIVYDFFVIIKLSHE
jgi:hypothetical protein